VNGVSGVATHAHHRTRSALLAASAGDDHYESDDESTATDSSHFEDVSGSSWDEGFFPPDLDEKGKHSQNGAARSQNGSGAVGAQVPSHRAGIIAASETRETNGNHIPSTTANGEPSTSPPATSSPSSSPPPVLTVESLELPTRSDRLTELHRMGTQLYEQCCRTQAVAASQNWTFFSRFLPRFG